jgi:glycosyltransferase involved in cell wall biosynthesis
LAAPRPARHRKLLFLVTEDYYFVSHRLALAQAAKAAGFDVAVVTRVRNHGDVIRRAGLRLVPFENVRSGLNPIREMAALARLIALYRRERPDIAHHVAMKPMLYGSMAARLSGVPLVVNAAAGMGWMFTSRTGLAQRLGRAVRWALGRTLRTGIALVQNEDDARLMADMGVPPSRIRWIAGSGVDVRVFRPSASGGGVPVVLFHARLLWDKGVGEFVEAARLLRQRGVSARFVLAGEPDPLNPASITAEQAQAWAREAIVEYRGWVTDTPALLAESDVVCLPSYREGLPKSLIEAAAAGRAIVTTDVPGCRAVVRHGDNGLLVPPGDAQALADALERLIGDRATRTAMGASGRMRAEREFGLDAVIQQTLAIYQEGPLEASGA